MSSSEVVRGAILDVLNTVNGIGLMHERERYSGTSSKLKEFYVVDGELAGGFIRRVGQRRVTPDGGQTFLVISTWEIHYFRGFQDAGDSELAFDQTLDAIDRAFVLDPTLGETVDTVMGDEQAGIALLTSQPAMFAGVLVHYAKMRLMTEHTDSA
ncbi:MAG: hypothetical protein Q7L07_13220 [Pseudohongiella sp.]|nr:hypothetical protein [Pseudohongiella sp.]